MPRRAQPGLLLLMAAVAVAVAPGAPCAAPAAACLPSCAPNIALKQCLHYLQESHKDELCGRDLSPGRRRDELEKLRLRHCCEHRVAEALPEAAFHDSRICRLRLQELLETDHLASHASCSHADLLLRYDCAQNYSIAFNCDQCKNLLVRFMRTNQNKPTPQFFPRFLRAELARCKCCALFSMKSSLWWINRFGFNLRRGKAGDKRFTITSLFL
ncbi:hypothetical protein ABEB36_003505 [Hypothenemus hampei]|uniref:Uncharacterized protein n=1 Tax=Hypothenemus hampei TaxID=57062 RepID=A0ABD1FD04_HYPHA